MLRISICILLVVLSTTYHNTNLIFFHQSHGTFFFDLNQQPELMLNFII